MNMPAEKPVEGLAYVQPGEADVRHLMVFNLPFNPQPLLENREALGAELEKTASVVAGLFRAKAANAEIVGSGPAHIDMALSGSYLAEAAFRNGSPHQDLSNRIMKVFFAVGKQEKVPPEALHHAPKPETQTGKPGSGEPVTLEPVTQ